MGTTKKTQPHWFPFTWSKRNSPFLRPGDEGFASRNIYEPSVLFDGRTSLMVFRGEDKAERPTKCVGRLGTGVSLNGIDFDCPSEPALVPDSPFESRGLAHPRLVLAGGVFILTYAAYDGARYRLCLATSTDSKNWFRHGPLFPELEDKGLDVTSGSIIAVPASDGKYYMYVGAGDLYMASSMDLLNWELQSKPVLKRKKSLSFASREINTGPSPFITRHGIVAILNGTDARYRTRPFAALFNLEKPGECEAYLREPFMESEHDWERFGYMTDSISVSGLSLRDDTFHLYYSGADRCMGLATAPVPKAYLFGSEESDEETSDTKDKPKICGV